jgi:hypothetical protein
VFKNIFQYRKYTILKSYSNQTKFLEVKDFKNATIASPNIVISENNEIISLEEYPPINSVETQVLLADSEYFYWKKIKKNENFLDTAFYSSSRDQGTFYHAINWVLTRILEFGFFQKDSPDKRLLLIDEKLHWRIKEYLHDSNKILANNWEIRELKESDKTFVSSLRLVSTLQKKLPEYSFVSREQAKNLSQVIQSKYQDFKGYEKIYLIRDKDARKQDFRNFINLTEVEIVLKSRGFHSLDLANYSLVDQMNIIGNAKVIIGVHGGNFSLIPFMKDKNAIVIEIFCGLIWSGFEIQAKRLELTYAKIQAIQTSKGYVLSKDSLKCVLENLGV